MLKVLALVICLAAADLIRVPMTKIDNEEVTFFLPRQAYVFHFEYIKMVHNGHTKTTKIYQNFGGKDDIVIEDFQNAQ